MHNLRLSAMAVVASVVLLVLAPSTDALRVVPSSKIRSRQQHLHLSSSMLFGSGEEGIRRHKNNILFSTPNGSNSEVTDIAKQSSSSSSSSASFLGAIDSFGMKLKPWAIGAYEKSLIYINKNNGSSNINGTDTTTTKTSVGTRRNNRFKRILYSLQSTILWVLYILYRGYRGFFVILPAVFKEVYRQLGESNLVVDVYGDDDDDDSEKEYAVNSNAVEQQPQQESLRLRTRITISILSAVLTLSYVVGGVLRILGSFIKTFTNTTSVEKSLEAAADEVAANEDKLRSKLK